MADRIPVRNPIKPRIQRPVARQVDTFEMPERNTDDEQLASALGELVPSLARLSGVLGEQKAAREKEAGEAKAREMVEDGKTFADAVKSGVIRKDQNPWFRVGAYETFGRVSGMKYVGDFLQAMEKSDVKDSTELADFDEFERKFRSEWVKGQLGDEPDPFLANAFGTTVDGQVMNLRNEFARAAGDRLVRANGEAFHAEIFNLAQQFGDLSASEREAAIRIAQERQVVTGGMTHAEVNRFTASAIAAAAVRMRDTTILDVLDTIPTDRKSKGFLGGTAYGSDLREKAEIAISRAIDDDVRREEALRKRTRDRAIQTISGGLVQALSQDPGADISAYIQEMTKVDPTYVPTLFAMRDTVASGSYADDPNVVRALTVGIHTSQPGGAGYTSRRDLDEAFAARNLTFQTYNTLSNELQQRDDAGGTGRFLKNPVLTDIESETYRMFVSEAGFSENTPGVRMNAQAAADEAVYEMLQWLRKNPDAEPESILTQKAGIRERIVRRRVGMQPAIEKQGTQTQSVSTVKPAGFLLVDPVLVGQLQREVEEMLAGTRNRLSPVFDYTLRKNDVDGSDPKAVTEFLKEQLKWTTSTSPKP